MQKMLKETYQGIGNCLDSFAERIKRKELKIEKNENPKSVLNVHDDDYVGQK